MMKAFQKRLPALFELALNRDYNLSILRFGLVGVLNLATDWGGYIVLVKGTDLPPAVANILSFSTAIGVSYYLNSRWTFSSSTESRQILDLGRIGKFILVNIGGLALSTSLVVIFNTVAGEVLAKALSVPIVFIYNFTASRTFVFKPQA